MKIYPLHHNYTLKDGDCEEKGEKKLGVYSTQAKAEKAITRYYKLPGFCDFPLSCFIIYESTLDRDSAWADGFIHAKDSDQDFETMTQCFIDYFNLDCEIEDMWKDGDYYNALCAVFYAVYRVERFEALATKIKEVFVNETIDKTHESLLEFSQKLISSLKLVQQNVR